MTLPERLEGIVTLFAGAPPPMKLQALLDYSKRLPPLPSRFSGDMDAMEQVPECQTPFRLATEIDPDGRVGLFFGVPAESPTVRGYAGILYEGLNGATPDEVLSVPADFYFRMGLQDAVSPLRIRGMGAIVVRLQRQVADLVTADE